MVKYIPTPFGRILAQIILLVFVGVWVFYIFANRYPKLAKVGCMVTTLGTVSQSLALFANGGFFPTNDQLEYDTLFPSYIPAHGANLAFLGDYYQLSTLSLGDILLCAGMFLFSINLFTRKNKEA